MHCLEVIIAKNEQAQQEYDAKRAAEDNENSEASEQEAERS